MSLLPKHASHLGRMVVVFAIGVSGFLLFRHFAVPEGFGQYGHYRGPVLAELQLQPVVHAGRAVCETCHAEMAETLAKGRHKLINCEACHGPLAKHADHPSLKPDKPVAAQLCGRCHEQNTSKPAGFPQVNTKEHMGGEACNTCHNAHKPKME